jgi:hypothetical protein
MKMIPTLVSSLAVFLSMGRGAQVGGVPVPRVQEDVSTVEVRAFDTRGKFLGAPNISLFESYDHRNLASQFHNGIAGRVPFGDYRIEARLTAYSSEIRYVRVYQRKTTVVLGLVLGHELPIIPLSMHGRVVGGRLPPDGRSFVKLSGVFSNLSMEATISADGGFDLVGLSWGAYLLMVIGENGILAIQAISIPYVGPPLEIEIGKDNAVRVQ